MNAINYNHQFKTLNFDEIPNKIKKLHNKRISYFDYCQYCDKCNIIFIFIIIDEDENTPHLDDCYFYLNNEAIFYYVNNLDELNVTCEEVQIKLLLE